LIKNYEREIAQLDEEKSELTKQLKDTEMTFEKMRCESKVDFDRELDEFRKKFVEYELKLNDKLDELAGLNTRMEALTAEKEILSKSKNFNLF
jgi:hypothetical protein